MMTFLSSGTQRDHRNGLKEKEKELESTHVSNFKRVRELEKTVTCLKADVADAQLQKEIIESNQLYDIQSAVRNAKKEERRHYSGLLTSEKATKRGLQSIVDTMVVEKRVSTTIHC